MLPAIRIYVWIFSVLLVCSLIGRVALFFKRRDLVGPFDLVESAFALSAIPALFGFVHQHAVGPHVLWMLLSALWIVLSFYHYVTPKMKKIYATGAVKAAATILGEVLLGLPALAILIDYAWLQPQLWIQH